MAKRGCKSVDKSDVHGVLVLWSAPGSQTTEHEPEDVHGTTVLLGSELRSWLDQFDDSHAAHFSTDAVWARVEELAHTGDDLDAKEGLVQRPTLISTCGQNVFAPLTAVVLATYAFFGSLHLGWAPAPFLETATAVVLGIASTRLRPVRLASIAWTTTTIGIAVIVGLDIAVANLAAH